MRAKYWLATHQVASRGNVSDTAVKYSASVAMTTAGATTCTVPPPPPAPAVRQLWRGRDTHTGDGTACFFCLLAYCRAAFTRGPDGVDCRACANTTSAAAIAAPADAQPV